MKKAPTTLIVMDGFGLSDRTEGNAVKAAKTPMLDRYRSAYAYTTLAASGRDVGLLPGQPGNSRAGQCSINSGRVVPQELPRINRAIEDGSFFENPVYNAAMDLCLERGTALHLMGLLSDGGVHASLDHLYALLKMASIKGLRRVYIHCFLDGRDVSPTSGREFVAQTMKKCAAYEVGRIATVMGRWYAMDRDKNWDRVEAAYDAMVYGDGEQKADPLAAIEEAYRNGVTDEMIEPIVCDRKGTVGDNDSVICYNFRPDRVVELIRAFVDPAFDGFNREMFPVYCVCSTEYGTTIPNIRVAFPHAPLVNDLNEFLANLRMDQLFVRDADACVAGILSGRYDVVRLTLSACSDAGHTRNFRKAIEAVEAVDAAVGRVVEETLQMGGIALVTSSHGNVEEMVDRQGRYTGANTTNRVPFLLCGAGSELRGDGRLADVAPTLLDVLGLAPPKEMNGTTLIVN